MGSYYQNQTVPVPFGNSVDGVETFPREAAGSSTVFGSTGVLRLMYFTPAVEKTITKIRTYSGGTAAAATPSLCRAGFYTVAASGDITLVCATANTTSLWASQNTEYSTSLDSGGGLPTSYTFVPGQRYAAAVLVVTGGTAPTFAGMSYAAATIPTIPPRVTGSLGSQTDLPTSVANGSIGTATTRYYVAGTAA